MQEKVEHAQTAEFEQEQEKDLSEYAVHCPRTEQEFESGHKSETECEGLSLYVHVDDSKHANIFIVHTKVFCMLKQNKFLLAFNFFFFCAPHLPLSAWG